MPTVIPEGFAQASALFDRIAGGDEAFVVTGHGLGLPPNDPTDVANAVFDAWEGSEIGTQFMATTWRMRQVSVRVNRGNGIETGTSTRAAIPGQASSPALPPNVAVLVRKVTGLGSREGRGRMYLPGTQEDIVNDNGVIIAPHLGNWQPFAQQFNALCAFNNVELHVLHSLPQLGGAPAPTPVATLVVQPLVATQRRRIR